jgi:hypothetical protein
VGSNRDLCLFDCLFDCFICLFVCVCVCVVEGGGDKQEGVTESEQARQVRVNCILHIVLLHSHSVVQKPEEQN